MIRLATEQDIDQKIFDDIRNKYLSIVDTIGDDLLGDYKKLELSNVVRRIINKTLSSDAPLGEKILDFGTGTSCLPAYLNSLGYEVWCLDDGSWHPEVNEKSYNEVYGSKVKYIVDDIVRRSDCLPDNYFDVIYSVSVMEHIPGYDKYIEILNKKLKKGGLHLHIIDIDIPEDVYQPQEGVGRIIYDIN
jgi:2-polyprenyl-3-methyl-5-hydroxy-6-metoxy-1,4-benzoquinol methylase